MKKAAVKAVTSDKVPDTSIGNGVLKISMKMIKKAGKAQAS